MLALNIELWGACVMLTQTCTGYRCLVRILPRKRLSASWSPSYSAIAFTAAYVCHPHFVFVKISNERLFSNPATRAGTARRSCQIYECLVYQPPLCRQTHSFTYAFHRAELVGEHLPHIRRLFICLVASLNMNHLGAFFNGVFLLALALSICLQSIERFVHVEVVDSPKLVLIIGCIGLALNIFSVIVVHGELDPRHFCDIYTAS